MKGFLLKNWIKTIIFFVFFALTAIFKKLPILSKNKHHTRKKHGPKPWVMDFPGDSSISSRKIIKTKMRQNLGHFDTKRIKVISHVSIFIKIFFTWVLNSNSIHRTIFDLQRRNFSILFLNVFFSFFIFRSFSMFWDKNFVLYEVAKRSYESSPRTKIPYLVQQKNYTFILSSSSLCLTSSCCFSNSNRFFSYICVNLVHSLTPFSIDIFPTSRFIRSNSALSLCSLANCLTYNKIRWNFYHTFKNPKIHRSTSHLSMSHRLNFSHHIRFLSLQQNPKCFHLIGLRSSHCFLNQRVHTIMVLFLQLPFLHYVFFVHRQQSLTLTSG